MDSDLRSNLSVIEKQQIPFVSLYYPFSLRKTLVLAYFEQLWYQSEFLYACLDINAEQSIPCAFFKPGIFYLGHPVTVIFNKLAKSSLIPKDAVYEMTVASDIFRFLTPSVGETKCSKVVDILNLHSDVSRLRGSALRHMRTAIASTKVYKDDEEMADDAAETKTSLNRSCILSPSFPEWAILMSIEHAHLTLETLVAYMRHQPLSALKTASVFEYWPHRRRAPMKSRELTPRNVLVKIQEGTVKHMGLRVEIKNDKSSDNAVLIDEEEFERALKRADARRTCRQGGIRGDVLVQPFLAAKFKVSNAEFLDFILDGGYGNEAFWTPAGLLWKQEAGVTHPKWWRVADSVESNEKKYFLRDTLEEIPLPMDWPVEVTLWEVDAFLRWKNALNKNGGVYALPTEAQHILFSGGHIFENEPAFEEAVYHGSALGSFCPRSNLDWKYLSPSPVDAHQPSVAGIHDPAGNSWEWVIDDAPQSTDPPTTESGTHALVGGCWCSSGDPATSARYNAGGPSPGRRFLREASFRYVFKAVP